MPSERSSDQRTGGRVLFVDDEAPLVRVALKAMGFSGLLVEGHTDPEAALRAFAARPADFDAVITDLSMPVMDGFRLIHELRLIQPGFPAVLTSGFLTSEHRAQAVQAGISIVPKPCAMDDLAQSATAAMATAASVTADIPSGP